MFAMELTCLGCGLTLRFGMEVGGGDAAPEPGAFSICWACAAVMRFVDPGPPAVVRLTTDEDNADMAAADVNRARQAVLDNLRFKGSFHAFSGPDADKALGAKIRETPADKIAIVGGIRCSKGPPPRQWKKKHVVQTRCGLCRQPIWLRHRPPEGAEYVGCSECIARAFIEEGKDLA